MLDSVEFAAFFSREFFTLFFFLRKTTRTGDLAIARVCPAGISVGRRDLNNNRHNGSKTAPGERAS